MATLTSEQQTATDEAGPLVPPDEQAQPERPGAPPRGYVGGGVATTIVAGLALWIMASWSAGASGDVLLGVAALGLVLCLPHTLAAWSGLTLLVATAAALLVGAQSLAESFADLAYYGLAVACLWGIWNEVARRFSWRMPARSLADRLLDGAPWRAQTTQRAPDAGGEAPGTGA